MDAWIGRLRRTSWLIMVPLLLLATWLGARGLNADSFWYDETLSAWRAGAVPYGGPLSLSEVWARSTADALQEPVYYLILAGWGNLVGLTELGGRSLSLLAGILAVALIYRLGRDMGSATVALGAAVAIGASAFAANYMNEMRTYSLYLLFTTITFWAYWRLTHPAGNRQYAGRAVSALFVACAFLVLYSHYFAVFTLGAIAAYHLLFVRKDSRWWRVTALGLFVALTYIPSLARAFNAVTYAGQNTAMKYGAMNAAQTVDTLFYTFANGSAALFVFIAGCALVGQRRSSLRQGTLFTLFVGVLILGTGLLFNAVAPVLTHIRYLFALWVPLALLVGFGVDRLARVGIPAPLALGIWITAGVLSAVNPIFIRNVPGTIVALPLRELAAVMQQHVQPTDALAFEVPLYQSLQEFALKYYLYNTPLRYQLMENILGREGPEYNTGAHEFIGSAPRVWIAVDKTAPSNFRLNAFQQIMAEDFLHCTTFFDLPDMSLDLYARKPGSANFQFGDEIKLTLDEPALRAARETLELTLIWSVASTVPPNKYSVGLHIATDSNPLVAQTDFGLPASEFACTYPKVDIRGLQPGVYTLHIVVYEWETGKRLNAMNLSTGEQGDWLALRQFTVKGQ